jgi:hypothetical protein
MERASESNWPFKDILQIPTHILRFIFDTFAEMARQWILTGQEGFETSLQYNDNAPIPSADQLGPNEVLVRIHAASLNKRDVDIASPNVSDPDLH